MCRLLHLILLKIGKECKNVLSAAVVIGALRVNVALYSLLCM